MKKGNVRKRKSKQILENISFIEDVVFDLYENSDPKSQIGLYERKIGAILLDKLFWLSNKGVLQLHLVYEEVGTAKEELSKDFSRFCNSIVEYTYIHDILTDMNQLGILDIIGDSIISDLYEINHSSIKDSTEYIDQVIHNYSTIIPESSIIDNLDDIVDRISDSFYNVLDITVSLLQTDASTEWFSHTINADRYQSVFNKYPLVCDITNTIAPLKDALQGFDMHQPVNYINSMFRTSEIFNCLYVAQDKESTLKTLEIKINNKIDLIPYTTACRYDVGLFVQNIFQYIIRYLRNITEKLIFKYHISHIGIKFVYIWAQNILSNMSVYINSSKDGSYISHIKINPVIDNFIPLPQTIGLVHIIEQHDKDAKHKYCFCRYPVIRNFNPSKFYKGEISVFNSIVRHINDLIMLSKNPKYNDIFNCLYRNVYKHPTIEANQKELIKRVLNTESDINPLIIHLLNINQLDYIKFSVNSKKQRIITTASYPDTCKESYMLQTNELDVLSGLYYKTDSNQIDICSDEQMNMQTMIPWHVDIQIDCYRTFLDGCRVYNVFDQTIDTRENLNKYPDIFYMVELKKTPTIDPKYVKRYQTSVDVKQCHDNQQNIIDHILGYDICIENYHSIDDIFNTTDIISYNENDLSDILSVIYHTK